MGTTEAPLFQDRRFCTASRPRTPGGGRGICAAPRNTHHAITTALSKSYQKELPGRTPPFLRPPALPEPRGSPPSQHANLPAARRVRAYLVIQAPQPRAVTPQAAGEPRVEATAGHLAPAQQLLLGHHAPVSPFQASRGVPVQAPSPPHSARFAPFPKLSISFEEAQSHGQQQQLK